MKYLNDVIPKLIREHGDLADMTLCHQSGVRAEVDMAQSPSCVEMLGDDRPVGPNPRLGCRRPVVTPPRAPAAESDRTTPYRRQSRCGHGHRSHQGKCVGHRHQ